VTIRWGATLAGAATPASRDGLVKGQEPSPKKRPERQTPGSAVAVDADDWATAVQLLEAYHCEGDYGRPVDDLLFRAIQIDQDDDDKRIVGIDLPFLDHNGNGNSTCPVQVPSLAGLDRLKRLALGGNHPQPSLPQGIGTLPGLEELTLSFPYLLQLPEDLFSDATNHKLKTLDLSNCSLLGRIPETIGSLTKLERLKLCLGGILSNRGGVAATSMANNNTNVVVPDDQVDLERLIPRSMGRLVNLKVLDLGSKPLPSLTTNAALRDHLVSIVSQWTQLQSLRVEMNIWNLIVPKLKVVNSHHHGDAVVDDAIDFSPSYLYARYWPELKDLTVFYNCGTNSGAATVAADTDTRADAVILEDDDDDDKYNRSSRTTARTIASALKRMSQRRQLKRLKLQFVLHNEFSVVSSAMTQSLFVPLALLAPLQDTLEDLEVAACPLEIDSGTTNRIVQQLQQQQECPPVLELAMQDIRHLFQLQVLKLERCRFVAPSSNAYDFDDAHLCDYSVVDDVTSATIFASTARRSLRLVRLEMVRCSQFFMVCDFVASHLDLSALQMFRLSQAGNELGDAEFKTLCTQIFKHCPKIQEVDLSDGNICHLTGTLTTCGANDDMFVLSCLPTDTLRVLELSRNPALCPNNGQASAPTISAATSDRNIQALWYLVARFPLLGFLGRFNILFLGRLGENYERLQEYYRLIHHLGLNRARSRVLKGQRVPRGMWASILFKAQRAFDDYPNHILARNRKELGDAMYNLLRERGADDIFSAISS